MNDKDVRAMLRKRADAAGSQKQFAANCGLSLPYINDVINGRKEPGKGILDALGLERVVTYRRKPMGDDADGVPTR